MSVTIHGKEFTNAKAQELGSGFLKAQPNRIMIADPESTEENPLPQIHKYTDLEWINKRGWDYYKREYKQGKKLMASDAAEIDDNILG